MLVVQHLYIGREEIDMHLEIEELEYFTPVYCWSSRPDSRRSSRVERESVADFFTSRFRVFKSDLYSLSFARSMAFCAGGKVRASRSIFLICRDKQRHAIMPWPERNPLQRNSIYNVKRWEFHEMYGGLCLESWVIQMIWHFFAHCCVQSLLMLIH